MNSDHRRALRRIDKHIAELQAMRRANFERVLEQIESDKRNLRRGNVDPAKVLELLERRVNEYSATHSSERNHRFGLQGFCEVMSLPWRGIERAKASGWMTFNMADRICCRLGVPTVCVYPYEQMSLEVSA